MYYRIHFMDIYIETLPPQFKIISKITQHKNSKLYEAVSPKKILRAATRILIKGPKINPWSGF